MNAQLGRYVLPPHWQAPESEGLLALLCGFSPRDRENRLLVMLQAFIDDSGKSEPPVYVLAGFIAPADAWASFSVDWKSVLDIPPRIEYFKASEAAACKGQFNAWSEPRRDERVNALIAVIVKHVKYGLFSMVEHATFKEIFKGKISRQMDNPHLMLFMGVMQAMMRYQHATGMNDRVDFIFDKELITKQVREAWDLFVRLCPPNVKPYLGARPIERDDIEVPPLQAADLLAWKERRYCWDRWEKKQEVFWPWASLDSVQMITEGWDKARLEAMFERVQQLKKQHGIKHPYDKGTRR